MKLLYKNEKPLLAMVFSLVFIFSSQVVHSEEEQQAAEEAQASAEQEYMDWAKGIWESLDRQQGEIKLPDNVATLNVPESFYYLNPKDTERVLVEVWGNPPGGAEYMLGMLFPAESTPFDPDAWGVTIEYQEDGYVSDDEADEINYDKMLGSMKKETREVSKERKEKGYEAIELVGWASKPFYEKDSHKLHWAKEIKFGDQEVNTLNYNIRVLGRKGVLVLNFIAGIDQLELIDSQRDTVLALAEFNQGSRYEDFNPSMDKVAAYGIGALVAGKVAAKTGLIAMVLIFLKKFGVLIFIGVGAFLAKMFKRKKEV